MLHMIYIFLIMVLSNPRVVMVSLFGQAFTSVNPYHQFAVSTTSDCYRPYVLPVRW